MPGTTWPRTSPPPWSTRCTGSPSSSAPGRCAPASSRRGQGAPGERRGHRLPRRRRPRRPGPAPRAGPARAAAGVAFELVPGVTAGVAAPAYAGIPVTHRGLATSVTFVTGHEDPSKPESQTDWAALARAGGTIVLYMGVRSLPRIARAL